MVGRDGKITVGNKTHADRQEKSSDTVRGYSRGRVKTRRGLQRASRRWFALASSLSRLLSPFHLSWPVRYVGSAGVFSGPKFQVTLRVGLAGLAGMAGLACFGCPLLVGCSPRPALKLLIRRT